MVLLASLRMLTEKELNTIDLHKFIRAVPVIVGELSLAINCDPKVNLGNDQWWKPGKTNKTMDLMNSDV